MDKERILVATDGSPEGDHAVRVASLLAVRWETELDLLHVEPVDGGAASDAAPGNESFIPPSGLRNILRARGMPGIEIARVADRLGASLVVLGRSSRTSGASHALGSIADDVIRRRDGPTLSIPRSVRVVRRALLAFDGTQRGLGLLPSASRLLSAIKTINEALIVLDGAGDGRLAGVEPQAVLDLRAALARFPDLGGANALSVRHGEPVSEVRDEFLKTESDLLVLGVRRGGRPGEPGSGHVGRDLLQTIPGAILTIPI